METRTSDINKHFWTLKKWKFMSTLNCVGYLFIRLHFLTPLVVVKTNISDDNQSSGEFSSSSFFSRNSMKAFKLCKPTLRFDKRLRIIIPQTWKTAVAVERGSLRRLQREEDRIAFPMSDVDARGGSSKFACTQELRYINFIR